MRYSRARSSLRARTAAALSVAVLLAALLHGTVAAALLWTLTATPLTSSVGVPTTYTLTATNLDVLNKLGCVTVDVSTSFAINATDVSSASGGKSWSASWTGKTVTVKASTDGDRLNLAQLVVFTILADGQRAGVSTWYGTGYVQRDCGGSTFPTIPLVITVTGPTATATPTPTPSPTPTPRPTSTPTPTALPTIPLPTFNPTLPPLPTLPPPIDGSPTATPSGSPRPTPTLPPGSTPVPSSDGRSPEPTDGAPSGSPDASSPGGSASSEPSPGLVIPGATPNNTPGSPASSGGVSVARDRDGTAPESVQTAGFGDLSGNLLMVGLPVLVFSVPGLLIILLVLLQVAGTAIWIPFVRRFRQPDQFIGQGRQPRSRGARRFRLGAWIPTSRQ